MQRENPLKQHTCATLVLFEFTVMRMRHSYGKSVCKPLSLCFQSLFNSSWNKALPMNTIFVKLRLFRENATSKTFR